MTIDEFGNKNDNLRVDSGFLVQPGTIDANMHIEESITILSVARDALSLPGRSGERRKHASSFYVELATECEVLGFYGKRSLTAGKRALISALKIWS